MSCITYDWLCQHEEELEKYGWVRMPEDADGCLMGTYLNLETVEMACNRARIQMALDLGGD